MAGPIIKPYASIKQNFCQFANSFSINTKKNQTYGYYLVLTIFVKVVPQLCDHCFALFSDFSFSFTFFSFICTKKFFPITNEIFWFYYTSLLKRFEGYLLMNPPIFFYYLLLKFCEVLTYAISLSTLTAINMLVRAGMLDEKQF